MRFWKSSRYASINPLACQDSAIGDRAVSASHS